MSFHSRTLLGGGGSAPGAPLTLDEEKETERKLKMLTADPLNSVFEDREFKAFKTKQYERAFPGKQELDATGRGIEPKPRAVTLEPFKPTVRRDDFKLAASVGEDERNRPSDVIKLKKVLSNAGIHDLDVTREKSTDAGETLLASLGTGQGLLGTKVDRMVKPGGETLRALEAVSFPLGATGDKARPVDLTKAAAKGAGSPLLAQAGTQSPAAVDGGGVGTLLAQAKTPQQSGAPIGSGIKKPSGPIKWPSIVTRLLQREGGFNANDPSNRGVKGTTLEDHLRRKGTPPKSPQDLKRALGNLSEAEAREVYDDIIARSKVDQIPDAGLAEQVFDGVVNHGPKNGIEQLQEGLNKVLATMGAKPVKVDGGIGPQTLGAIGQVIQAGGLRQLRNAVVDKRRIKIDKFVDGRINDPRNTLPVAVLEALRKALYRRADLFRP